MTETPDFDLDSWIDGATVAQVSLDVIQKPHLLGKFEDWERRFAAAERIDSVAERSIGDPDPLAALEAEGEALRAQMRASMATIFLRALDGDDVAAIEKAHPLPEKPAMFDEPMPELVKNPTDAQAKAFAKASEFWELARDKFNAAHKDEHEAWATAARQVLENRGIEQLATSFAGMSIGGKIIAEGMSFDQAAKFIKKIGPVQLKRIIAEIGRVTEMEPEVPAGFLSRTSESDQD